MVAQAYNISRQKQDEYALVSHSRASEAARNSHFADEILPIEVRGAVIDSDDTVRHGVTQEGLAVLKSAFPDWGEASTTAGNASGVGDGAALCVLTTRERAEREGFNILGKYIGTAVVGVEPRYMGISPIYAIPKILDAHGLTKKDVDVYEVSHS